MENPRKLENREVSVLHFNKTVALVDKEKAGKGEDWRQKGQEWTQKSI